VALATPLLWLSKAAGASLVVDEGTTTKRFSQLIHELPREYGLPNGDGLGGGELDASIARTAGEELGAPVALGAGAGLGEAAGTNAGVALGEGAELGAAVALGDTTPVAPLRAAESSRRWVRHQFDHVSDCHHGREELAGGEVADPGKRAPTEIAKDATERTTESDTPQVCATRESKAGLGVTQRPLNRNLLIHDASLSLSHKHWTR
jgi:hypothetical protein